MNRKLIPKIFNTVVKKATLQPKHKNVDSVKYTLRISRMLFLPARMSARYYLPSRHDTIAEAIYTALRKKEDPNAKIYCNKSE